MKFSFFEQVLLLIALRIVKGSEYFTNVIEKIKEAAQ